MAPAPGDLPTLLPKPPASSTGRSREDEEAAAASRPKTTELTRKRQAVSSACDNCRKRHAKCDGTRPLCGPCRRAGLQCGFANPQGLTQRQNDQQKFSNFQSVIEFLHEGSHEEAAQALQRIRESDDVVEAVNSIADSRLLLSAPTANAGSGFTGDALQEQPRIRISRRERGLLSSPQDDTDFMFEKQYMANARDQYLESDIIVDVFASTLPLSRWTNVSTDDRLLNHLINLFFTWDNIVERVFYRPIFEEDVVALDPSAAENRANDFCSRFLVSALLAVSCLYTLDTTTFKDLEDSTTRGRRWADEAETLLEQIDAPSISLLQGLYALFVYEGCLGPGHRSVRYFLRAMDVYKALNDLDASQQIQAVDEGRRQREKQATSWCMWGFYCCEWRSSQAFGFRKLARKPKVGRAWRESQFPLSQPDCVGYWWSPYPMSLQTQKSMQVEVREVEVNLSEIVEEALDFIYPEEGELPPFANPKRGLELYNAFVDWKISCPSRIRFEEAVLPATILLHIGLELMFTAVLRPFSLMTKEEFGSFNPRERCYAHAGSLVSAIWTFRAFSILRFEYWLTHAGGTAAYIVIRESEKEPIQIDTLVRACQCLHEMRASLPLATDALAGIHAAFKRYKLPVPEYMKKYFATTRHRKDGVLHHAVAALLPDPSEIGRIRSGAELQLQELLNGFDGFGID